MKKFVFIAIICSSITIIGFFIGIKFIDIISVHLLGFLHHSDIPIKTKAFYENKGSEKTTIVKLLPNTITLKKGKITVTLIIDGKMKTASGVIDNVKWGFVLNCPL